MPLPRRTRAELRDWGGVTKGRRIGGIRGAETRNQSLCMGGGGANRAGGRGALGTTREDDHRGCGVEGNPRQQPGGGCPLARGVTWAGEGRQDLQEGLQVVPSSALAGQRAARSPLPLAVCPPTQLACAPTGEPVAPQIPGKGAPGRSTGQLRGDSPPRCQPGGSRPGRGEGAPAHPPPHDCPGRRALPRSARRSPSCSIYEPLTPSGASAPPGASVLWAARFGLALPSAPLGGPLPALRPARALRRASARRSFQPGEGPVLCSHEGGNPPPLPSHPRTGPPSRDPQEKTDWSARPGSS